MRLVKKTISQFGLLLDVEVPVIGYFRIKEGTEYTEQYATASWYRSGIVEPGLYPILDMGGWYDEHTRFICSAPASPVSSDFSSSRTCKKDTQLNEPMSAIYRWASYQIGKMEGVELIPGALSFDSDNLPLPRKRGEYQRTPKKSFINNY